MARREHASLGQPKRSGFDELSALDQPKMAARSAVFRGVKLGAEFAGVRPLRHQLHTDPSTAPPGAKVVYLLRHGEGVHNVWRKAEMQAGRTPCAKSTGNAPVRKSSHHAACALLRSCQLVSIKLFESLLLI